MSRNYDLLTEIERERHFAPTNDRVRVSAASSAAQIGFPKDTAVDRPEISRLVRSVFLSNTGHEPRQVVFCGVDSENGSSSICANAGRTLAFLSSKPVCLIDGNIHSAPMSRLLGVGGTVPSSNDFSMVRERCSQISENLWLAGTHLMTDGRGSLLPPDEIKQCLTELDSEFEFLLIDAPGIHDSNDAELLCQVAESAILVIEANKTRRTAAAKAKENLEAAGVKLLGTVLNNRSFPIPHRLYDLL